MSATALNRLLRRPRRRAAVLAVILGLTGALAVHHLDAGDMGMQAAMVMCVAVVPAVAVAAVAAVGALWSLPRRTLRVRWPPVPLPALMPLPRARAGPVATVVLRC